MNEPDLDTALDAALRRSLKAPGLPSGFREQLRAAIARSASVDHAALRRELEREERETLRAMHEGYVRVRRQAMVTLLLAAFVAGAGATWALPLLVQQFGSQAGLVLAGIGAVAGLGIALAYVLRGQWQPVANRLARWLP
jgi:hypothetical protein